MHILLHSETKITLFYLLLFAFVRFHLLYHSLLFNIVCYHSLSLVVSLVVIRCHSLSLFVPLVVTARCQSFYHPLSLVVTRCATRLCFYKRSFFHNWPPVPKVILVSQLEWHQSVHQSVNQSVQQDMNSYSVSHFIFIKSFILRL